ncbi:succinylglutamate desuccinylase/aspartoacylase family protein [Algoriphagus vanfongensis]|uniref:succinylglutamate desuccinylase/aspartoacylase family protein n=1 Tax=Algoriphagus vanfongensis TaxID=426371 RepID=UPI0004204EA9|nr:succinylglutamate desuccinylase/aspartoacylase family protein [Algoriphagus vanfongensis]
MTNYQKIDPSRLKRIIGEYPEDQLDQTSGPFFLVSGAVHGNEPSGVLAVERVISKLIKEKPKMKGKILGVVGNLTALAHNVRMIDQDLNRVCTPELAEVLKKEENIDFQEGIEFHELVLIIEKLEKDSIQKEIFFMDLHTTSSVTIPYVSVNKKEANFEFAKEIPLPLVKGIEQFIPGHFDHFLTQRGHIGFTMEAGQHDDSKSVDFHEAAIWIALIHTGMLKRTDIDYDYYYHLLKKSSPIQEEFEVIYRLDLKSDQEFTMEPGFENFSHVKPGQLLAKLDGEKIIADDEFRVFLPLYQKQGSDGFFIVKST